MKACAYVVGPEDASGAALRELARQVGFETVLPFRSIGQAEQQAGLTPLVFFLFSTVARPRRMQTVADAVRRSDNRRIRFAPMIYFSESPALSTIRACIEMGFDDVITLPFTLARIEERLERQLERPVVYFEAGPYFGPEREDPARRADGQYRRFEFLRSPGLGINVTKEDLHLVV